jgi:filamentous hemagglutinin
VVWKLGPGPRGEAIEQALGHNLPGNFPVIDRFNNGIATSIKSIDLDGASYLTGNTLRNTLTRYVDKTAAFNGKTWAGREILSNQINGRALEVIVPHSGTAAQQATLSQIIKYGSTKGVTVNVIPYP